jgi:hypothetical protein
MVFGPVIGRPRATFDRATTTNGAIATADTAEGWWPPE